MSFYVSTATFFLLHCDEWDRVVALSRHKFVTEATLLQLEPGADPGGAHPARAPPKIGKNMIFCRKIVIFHTKYLKNFRASLRSAQFF